MQSTMQPPRRRGVAFSTGIIFALIAAIIIFGFGALNGFRTGMTANPLWGWAWIFALFATPLLAGFVGALRSSRIGSGTLAGLWDGLFVGLWIAAFIMIVYFLAGSNLDAAIKQIQDQMARQGTSVTITRDTILTSLIVADVLLVIIFLGIGTLLGLIGALIGKPFAPRRRY